MATAGGSYEGGVGGKLRTRTFRRASTPYDRPPSAIRNPTEAGTKGWLLKIVDPASRIITTSAQRFLPSLFKKSLPALQTISESNHESRDAFPEVVSFNPHSGAQDEVSNQGNNQGNSSDSSGINELEQILKQKTFTRAEIDHLTELLHSRTVNASAEDEKRSEPSQQPAAHDRQELANVHLQENGLNRQSLLGRVSAPVFGSTALEEDVASPAELAKAYMGSRRSSQVTPSTVGLQSQVFREDFSLSTNTPFRSKSPGMLLAPRSGVRFAGVSENGFQTPGPRGRSAIYTMPRTPYSRVHYTATHKGVGSPIDGNVGPSTCSPWLWEKNTLSGSKQVSKRRNSVLDCDIGSIGPIRRIRRKTNIISPSKIMRLQSNPGSLSIPVTVAGSDAAQGSTSLMIQKPLLLDEPKHNRDNSTPSKDFASVPSQSTEMARKIMQQLDKLAPSPKEKTSEFKLVTARGKSPSNSGWDLRSVENLDSSKLIHNIQGTGPLDGLEDTNVPCARDFSSQKQARVHENGPIKISVSALASEANGESTLMSAKDTMPSLKNMDSVISNFVANPALKKRHYQISAHEESLELSKDSFSSRVGSATLAVEKGKLDDSAVDRKAIAFKTVLVENHLDSKSDIKPTASFLTEEKDVGFTFPATPIPCTTTQPDVPIFQSPSLFNRPAPLMKQTAAPMFSIGAKNATTVPFSSSSFGASEFSGLKFGAQSDSNLHTISSNSTVAVTTETALNTVEFDKGNRDKTQKAADIFRLPENAISTSVSASVTPTIFSSGVFSSNSSLHNGSVSRTPSASGRSTSDSFFSSATPNAVTTNTSRSGRSISATTSTSSAAPMFQFGTSIAASPSNPALFPSAISAVDSADSEPKTKRASSIASPNNPPFIFGASAPSSFTTANPSSSANNLFQSSNTAIAAGPLFDARAVPGTGVTPFTQSMPMQFGSSASSPAFGLNGSSAFSSGTSLFGSSSSGANLFGSSSGFGVNSSTTSTGASSFSSASGTTNLFGSGTQFTASSNFSGFGSTSSAPGFSFGLSSTAATTTSSAPVAFGSSSSGSVFSFSSAATTTSSATFGSASPSNEQMNMDSMAEDAMQASTPTVSVFGQPANSPPPSNFMFGSPPLLSGESPLFQFSSQHNPVTPQNPSPFQVSGNLGFSSGGSFSLGTGDADKSTRKFVKARREKLRKK